MTYGFIYSLVLFFFYYSDSCRLSSFSYFFFFEFTSCLCCPCVPHRLFSLCFPPPPPLLELAALLLFFFYVFYPHFRTSFFLSVHRIFIIRLCFPLFRSRGNHFFTRCSSARLILFFFCGRLQVRACVHTWASCSHRRSTPPTCAVLSLPLPLLFSFFFLHCTSLNRRFARLFGVLGARGKKWVAR